MELSIGTNDAVTAIALAVVCVVTTEIQSWISKRSWKRSIIDTLDVYDALASHATTADEFKAAELVKSRAFRLAKKASPMSEKVTGGIRSVLFSIDSNSVATKIAFIEFFFCSIIPTLASGHPVNLYLAYVLIPFGIMMDVFIYLSRKRENRASYGSEDHGDDKPHDNERRDVPDDTGQSSSQSDA